MMTSQSKVSVKNMDETSQENKNEMSSQFSETNESREESTSNQSNISSERNTISESNPKQFEDNSSDFPEDATKGDERPRKKKTSKKILKLCWLKNQEENPNQPTNAQGVNPEEQSIEDGNLLLYGQCMCFYNAQIFMILTC